MIVETKNLKKALEEFLPHLKGLDDQIAVQEGKLDNLMQKRVALDRDIEEKIRKSDEVLAQDKAKSDKRLADAEKVLAECHSLFLTVYKANVMRTQLTKEQADKFTSKAKEADKKLAELKAE